MSVLPLTRHQNAGRLAGIQPAASTLAARTSACTSRKASSALGLVPIRTSNENKILVHAPINAQAGEFSGDSAGIS
jgi:hypothetical protein